MELRPHQHGATQMEPRIGTDETRILKIAVFHLCFIRGLILLSFLSAVAPSFAQDKRKLDRYPLTYPPQLAGGGTQVTEQSPEFLKAGPNLREGVEIAKTPPVVDFAFYPKQDYPGNPWSHRSDGIVVGDGYYP